MPVILYHIKQNKAAYTDHLCQLTCSPLLLSIKQKYTLVYDKMTAFTTLLIR
jgi:hypothetical protein